MSKSSEKSARRVGVALSGGVDSAAAAARLKEQGADVVGLTMLLRPEDDAGDASRVARALDVPLHVFDFRERFRACVVEPFADSYLRGETPNPCVYCNRRLKFGDLAEEAKKLGAYALATGHYARRLETSHGAELHAGADPGRDQSYFLFALSQEQLEFLRFPLSDMSKDEARALAALHALPVAAKKDSQDICFVPDGDYAGVLEKLRPGAERPGEIVDEEGSVLGRHEGIVHFTVGQRRGLNIGDRKGEANEPLFVLRLDATQAQVVVGPRARLARREVFLRDMNWLAQEMDRDRLAEEGAVVAVRLRSTQKLTPARFFMREKDAGSSCEPRDRKEKGWEGLIRFSEPVFGVSPGQAGVVYAGSRVLGGGWISGAV